MRIRRALALREQPCRQTALREVVCRRGFRPPRAASSLRSQRQSLMTMGHKRRRRVELAKSQSRVPSLDLPILAVVILEPDSRPGRHRGDQDMYRPQICYAALPFEFVCEIITVVRLEVANEPADGDVGAVADDAEVLVQDDGLVPVDPSKIEISWMHL